MNIVRHGEPNMKKAVIVIDDRRGHGDIVVEQAEPGCVLVWFQIETGPGDTAWWELGGTHNTLAGAMGQVATIIESNIENDFYEEM